MRLAAAARGRLSRAVAFVLALAFAFAGSARAEPPARVLRLEAKGAITPPLSAHIRDGIAAAESAGAGAPR